MAYTPELEKLERQYQDNPRRFAAPYADALRKSGEMAQALEIVEVGLELNPQYIPASVVLGRCHLDMGNDEAAEQAFNRVLELDQENVIALKALADIAERQGRLAEAERLLVYLLDVDRSNEEAREQLDRVLAVLPAERPEEAAVEPAAEPEAAAVPAEPATAAPFEAVTELPEAWPVSGSDDVIVEEPEDAVPIAGADAEDLGVLRQEDIVLEPSVSNEFQSPGDADSLVAHREGMGASPEDATAPVVPALPFDPWPATPFPEAQASVPPTEEAEQAEEAEGPAPEEAATVVTETMAELYLRQGHRQEALEVYRALLGQHPGDDRLAAKVAALEAPARPAPSSPPPRLSGRAFAAAESGGRSLGDFLSALLAERPGPVDQALLVEEPPLATDGAPDGEEPFRGPESPEDAFEADRDAPVEARGAPTRPAHDHLSLSAIFGEESGSSSSPGGGRADPSSGSEAPGFSFDQFFKAKGEGEEGAAGSGRPTGTSDDDDLDQFHTWLQGLKK